MNPGAAAAGGAAAAAAGGAAAAAAGGAAAAATAGQNLGQQLVVHPCQTWHSDLARDPFFGNYAAMCGDYDLALTPSGVRTRIYSNGNNSVPISHLLVAR